MPEVIDLTFSSPLSISRDQPRLATAHPTVATPSGSPHFLSDSFGRLSEDKSTLFHYDDSEKPVKKRKLNGLYSASESTNLQADLFFTVSDDDAVVSFQDSLEGQHPTAYPWDGEVPDPIVFTSPIIPPRRNPPIQRSNVQEPTTLTTGDNWDDSHGPLTLPDDVQPSKSHLSGRTAGLLASLENKKNSRTSSRTARSSALDRNEDRTRPDETLTDEILEPEQPKRRRQQKPSHADREAKAKERDDAKAEREREREEKKEQKLREKEVKAKEKQLAADIAEVNKLKIDKKAATPEMILEIASSFKGTSVGNQVTEFMIRLEVEQKFFSSSIPNIVKWQRKVKATYNEEVGRWEPCALHTREEDHVLCLLSAQEFVEMATAPTSSDRAGALERHVLRVRRAYPGRKLIYLIEGLLAWVRKNKNLRNRIYQTEVLRQLHDGTEPSAPQSNGQSRKRTLKNLEIRSPIDDDIIEDALLQLQVTHSCLIHQSVTPSESAEWIKHFTEHIATIPYRRERMELNDSAFCMDSGQVKAGEDRADTFVRMLQEINRVTGPMAYGITANYPSVVDLLRGMKRHGPLLLEDVKKSANKSGALTESRIGPAVSKRIYKVFMGLDPTSTDI